LWNGTGTQRRKSASIPLADFRRRVLVHPGGSRPDVLVFGDMFRLAHITDPHFHSLDGIRFSDLRGKRIPGAANFWLTRQRRHKMQLLAALGDHLRQQPHDHFAFTGDLSNLSLEGEWRAAKQWMNALAQPREAISVIPGNHDAYVADVVDRRAFETHFGDYQTSDVSTETPYPFVQLRGPLALIGVNSCVATGDLGAWGIVDASQRARLEALLTHRDVRDKIRVVMIHHPPVRLRGGEHRNLREREALAETLKRAGAELVIHGHDHRDERATLEATHGRSIPVVGGGSASYAGAHEGRARYNTYEFDGTSITLVTRAHNQSSGGFDEVKREVLAS
jgi:3',5'-cyclic AMP phosphodiesterase CpdA